MPFLERVFFRNANRGDWQRATDALEEGFDHLLSDYLQLDTAAAETGAVGRIIWQSQAGTASLGLVGGAVSLSIGAETYVRVYNGTGTAFTRGQVVRLEGSQGLRLSVALSQASNEGGSSKTIGVTAEEIGNNSEGWIMTSGHLDNLNTNALTEGALAWLSPTVAGGVTTTKPAAPDHLVLVGQCVKKAGGAGILFVHIQNGYEIEELHNVSITNPQDGDVLTYDSTSGLWINAAP